jgi:hypothetical protein
MNISEFFGGVYHDNRLRLQNRRSLLRDVALYAKNRALQPLGRRLARARRDPSQPIVFIVGAPRSGTTLLFQLLARHWEITFPSNFVARYWMAPVFGMKRYEKRYGSARKDIPLESEFGGAPGPHSPHEFSWFWQFHLGFWKTDAVDEKVLDAVDWREIRLQIEGMAGWGSRPVLFKSLNCTVYNIRRFAREFPQARFVHIRRDPLYVVESILKCRVQRYGSDRLWWTIRPRDVEDWLGRDPVEQVCHQVTDIRGAVEKSLAGIDPSRWAALDYERLVRDPLGELDPLARLFGRRRLPEIDPPPPRQLPNGNAAVPAATRLGDIRRALEGRG